MGLQAHPPLTLPSHQVGLVALGAPEISMMPGMVVVEEVVKQGMEVEVVIMVEVGDASLYKIHCTSFKIPIIIQIFTPYWNKRVKSH